MAKVSDKARLEFRDAIKPYQEKITATLEKEKTILNSINDTSTENEYKKIGLCEDMIYVATLYMAQNSISLKVQEVKNNDALNDARKIIYKAIIYLEEIVTNIIDIPYSDLEPNQKTISKLTVVQRYALIRKLGLAIRMLKDAFGDNSKWRWSFVEIDGRFATVAKNFIDTKAALKIYNEPREADYETVVMYFRLIQKLLNSSATAYRDKYELSTRRIDDMQSGIKFLLASRRFQIALGQSKEAEELKKKALVWKDKMNADHKSGSSR